MICFDFFFKAIQDLRLQKMDAGELYAVNVAIQSLRVRKNRSRDESGLSKSAWAQGAGTGENGCQCRSAAPEITRLPRLSFLFRRG